MVETNPTLDLLSLNLFKLQRVLLFYLMLIYHSDWFSNYYSNLGIKSNSDSLIKEFQKHSKIRRPSDLQNIVDKTKKAEEFFEERNEDKKLKSFFKSLNN